MNTLSSTRFATAALVLFTALAAPAGHKSARDDGTLHSTLPVGFVVVQLRPSGGTLSIMGLVECAEMEGLHQVSQGLQAKMVTARGEPLREFPRHFSFRITATLRKTLIDGPDRDLTTVEDPHDLLLKLGFRLKIYDGLDTEEMVPTSVEVIGVPADVNYDERVFRVNFDVGSLPVTDRMILEVISPEGVELTHFPFGLL